MLRAEIVLTEMYAIRTACEGQIDTIVDDYSRTIAMSVINGVDRRVVKLAGRCVLVS